MNKYDGFDPKSDESYIMFSLLQNVFQSSSINLADKIQDEFQNRVKRYNKCEDGRFSSIMENYYAECFGRIGVY